MELQKHQDVSGSTYNVEEKENKKIYIAAQIPWLELNISNGRVETSLSEVLPKRKNGDKFLQLLNQTFPFYLPKRCIDLFDFNVALYKICLYLQVPLDGLQESQREFLGRTVLDTRRPFLNLQPRTRTHFPSSRTEGTSISKS